MCLSIKLNKKQDCLHLLQPLFMIENEQIAGSNSNLLQNNSLSVEVLVSGE